VGWAGAALLNDRRVEDGWSRSKAKPTFIDGHERRRIAIDAKVLLPTLIGRWDPREEGLILATLDPLTAVAEANPHALLELLSSVTTEDLATRLLLQGLADREEIDLTFVEFPEFDESVVDSVEYNECPNCGHRWPR
jgi:hypothetical protein